MFSIILETVQFVNQYIILPLTLVTFIMLLYFVMYLGKHDPDVLKSKIFLRFDDFRKAFAILAIVAFALIFHVFFIYLHDFIHLNSQIRNILIPSLQQLLGLVLATLMLLFAYKMFRVVKK